MKQYVFSQLACVGLLLIQAGTAIAQITEAQATEACEDCELAMQFASLSYATASAFTNDCDAKHAEALVKMAQFSNFDPNNVFRGDDDLFAEAQSFRQAATQEMNVAIEYMQSALGFRTDASWHFADSEWADAFSSFQLAEEEFEDADCHFIESAQGYTDAMQKYQDLINYIDLAMGA